MDGSGEDENGGLFNMEFSSADESSTEPEKKVPRDFQSEEDFQRQLREWRPKVERGEVCFPLHPLSNTPCSFSNSFSYFFAISESEWGR